MCAAVPTTFHRFLWSQVERVKRVLSTQHQARVEIESLVDGEDFSETLTRARFEEVRLLIRIRAVQCTPKYVQWGYVVAKLGSNKSVTGKKSESMWFLRGARCNVC